MIKYKKYLFTLSVIFSCGMSTPSKYSVFYLPERFEGFIAIVYSQETDLVGASGLKRTYNIPESGILLISDKFDADATNDLYLMKNGDSYDTLRYYLPLPNFSNMNFDTIGFNKKYTRDSNEVAVNKREVRKPTFYRYDNNGEKIGECTFNYQFIAIGKAATLNDSLGRVFIEKLGDYFQNRLCK